MIKYEWGAVIIQNLDIMWSPSTDIRAGILKFKVFCAFKVVYFFCRSEWIEEKDRTVFLKVSYNEITQFRRTSESIIFIKI